MNCNGFRIRPGKKHREQAQDGIDFEEAQMLWADPELVEIPARTTEELRWLLIGRIGEKHWSAVITRRGEDTRLISVRRARDEEVSIHESEDI